VHIIRTHTHMHIIYKHSYHCGITDSDSLLRCATFEICMLHIYTYQIHTHIYTHIKYTHTYIHISNTHTHIYTYQIHTYLICVYMEHTHLRGSAAKKRITTCIQGLDTHMFAAYIHISNTHIFTTYILVHIIYTRSDHGGKVDSNSLLRCTLFGMPVVSYWAQG